MLIQTNKLYFFYSVSQDHNAMILAYSVCISSFKLLYSIENNFSTVKNINVTNYKKKSVMLIQTNK